MLAELIARVYDRAAFLSYEEIRAALDELRSAKLSMRELHAIGARLDISQKLSKGKLLAEIVGPQGHGRAMQDLIVDNSNGVNSGAVVYKKNIFFRKCLDNRLDRV